MSRCLSTLFPFSLTMFTKYSLGPGLFVECLKYAASLSSPYEVGDYYPHFADEEGSER